MHRAPGLSRVSCGNSERTPLEGYRDVVERLFGLTLDLASDQGDFLQVRFWLVLEKIVVQAFEQQLAKEQIAEHRFTFRYSRI